MQNEISEFDYKKYSLDKLKTWIQDSLQCGATPIEIYSVIVETVQEDVDVYRKELNNASKLLDLLKGKEP